MELCAKKNLSKVEMAEGPQNLNRDSAKSDEGKWQAVAHQDFPSR
jgi:hypothetical protein